MLALALSAVVTWTTFAPAPPARNPFDVFRVIATQPAPIELAEHGPTREHPVATECEITDRACVTAHDDNVLNLALMTGRKVICEGSTRQVDCEGVVDMVNGDIAPDSDPMLTDPCTFVVKQDRGGALLYSKLSGRSRWAKARAGWKTAAFIGVCDIRTLSDTSRATELPQFPWVSQ